MKFETKKRNRIQPRENIELKKSLISKKDYSIYLGYDSMIRVKKNELYFNGEIDSLSVNIIIKTLEELCEKVSGIGKNKSGKKKVIKKWNKTVYFHIDSGGGSVLDTIKLLDKMKEMKKIYKTKFISVISPLACSAATMIAVSCDKIHMTKNSVFMVHELSTGDFGIYTHLQSKNSYTKYLHSYMVELYCKKTGLSKDKIKKMLLKETWLTSKQALQLKFVDKII